MNVRRAWTLVFNHQIFRCDDWELAQVQVDGDDFAGERHDSSGGGVERADDVPSAVAYGHGCRGDNVVIRAELVKVTGLAHDDTLRNLDIC